MNNPRAVINESELELSADEVAMLLTNREVEQGDEAWFEERLGKVTASKVKEVVLRDRYGKPYKGYYDYLMQLAIERVTDKSVRFSNKYTDHGNTNEEFAANAYEELTGHEVRETGFHEHPTLAAGASPDRLIDEDGTLEIKAPNSQTLLKYLVSMISEGSENYELVTMLGLKGNEWEFYYEQIQMQLWITDRKWCDFCIYDPDLPENIQLIVKRVDRDNKYITEVMEPRVVEFLERVNTLEHYLREYNNEIQPKE